jgi:hypothetical protein
MCGTPGAMRAVGESGLISHCWDRIDALAYVGPQPVPQEHIMKRSLTVAALSGLLLVVTACGSDDDGVSAEQSERDDTDAESGADDGANDPPSAADDAGTGDADTPDATSADAGEQDVDDEDVSEAEGDGDDGDPGDITLPGNLPASIDGECAEVYQQFQDAISGFNPADPDLAGIESAFDELAATVPDELQDDVEVLDEVFGEVAAIVEDYDGDYADMLSDPDTLEQLSALQGPEVRGAEERLSAYFAETCPELNELG